MNTASLLSPAMHIPWVQISGAVAGGVVGGFMGFLANILDDARTQRQERRNIAAAIVGELEGLCEQIGSSQLVRRDDAEGSPDQLAHLLFRGERDYTPIFRSVGSRFGLLPAPLPRELVKWYTGLTVCQERVHELHDLARTGERGWRTAAAQLSSLQHEALAALMARASVLIADLSKL